MNDIQDKYAIQQPLAIQEKCERINIKSLRHLHSHYLSIVEDVNLCTLNDCLWLMCIKKEIANIKEKYGTGCPEKIAEIQRKEKKQEK
tara:strand:+ start:226 stop:489 length:264 start_codon:yes stop_codon:yes gene_type:complete